MWWGTFELTLNASDIDSDTLTWSISSAPQYGTASVSGTGASKEIAYILDETYRDEFYLVMYDSFVVKVTDGEGGEASVTVNVDVDSGLD